MSTRFPARIVLALFALAAASCDCDGGLDRLPTPQAELRHGDDATPPLDHLTVAVGTTALSGEGLVSTVSLHNLGDADLELEGVNFVEEPDLCAAQGAGFSLIVPTGGFAVSVLPGEHFVQQGRSGCRQQA